ncbi:MAG: sensor histidine kinase [Thermodesulfobacteriota bacterium]
MEAHSAIEKKICTYFDKKASVLFFVLSKDGHIIQANEFAEKTTGMHPVGKNIRDLIVDFSGTLDLNRCFQDTDREHLLNIITVSGLPQTFYFTFEQVSDSILAFGRLDVDELETMRKEVFSLNQELNNLMRRIHKKNAQLERLNQEKNQFLGMAAHDLRKPIGLVITFSEFLKEEAAPSLDDEQIGFLNTIHDAAVFMKRLVDDFLDVSAIEAGKFELETEPCRIQDVLRQSLALNQLQADMKGVEIQVDFMDNPPAVIMDPPKIEQAMTNLISNAIEHSTFGHRVIISVDRKKNFMTFSVRDSGPGIPPQELDRLFKPFSMTSVKKTGGEKSTGLGMLITRKIIEAHRGEIWVDSRLGVGTTFFFSLPLDNKT